MAVAVAALVVVVHAVAAALVEVAPFGIALGCLGSGGSRRVLVASPSLASAALEVVAVVVRAAEDNRVADLEDSVALPGCSFFRPCIGQQKSAAVVIRDDMYFPDILP